MGSHDGEIVGWEWGSAREAERALEEACLARFGTLHLDGDMERPEAATG